jgi:hypothetical protein
VHVALGPNAHGGGDRLVVLLAHLDGPLHLFNVLEILNRNGKNLGLVDKKNDQTTTYFNRNYVILPFCQKNSRQKWRTHRKYRIRKTGHKGLKRKTDWI